MDSQACSECEEQKHLFTLLLGAFGAGRVRALCGEREEGGRLCSYKSDEYDVDAQNGSPDSSSTRMSWLEDGTGSNTLHFTLVSSELSLLRFRTSLSFTKGVFYLSFCFYLRRNFKLDFDILHFAHRMGNSLIHGGQHSFSLDYSSISVLFVNLFFSIFHFNGQHLFKSSFFFSLIEHSMMETFEDCYGKVKNTGSVKIGEIILKQKLLRKNTNPKDFLASYLQYSNPRTTMEVCFLLPLVPLWFKSGIFSLFPFISFATFVLFSKQRFSCGMDTNMSISFGGLLSNLLTQLSLWFSCNAITLPCTSMSTFLSPLLYLVLFSILLLTHFIFYDPSLHQLSLHGRISKRKSFVVFYSLMWGSLSILSIISIYCFISNLSSN